MFLLICGENTVESRNYLTKLKNTYRAKHTTLIEVPARELQDKLKDEQIQTLFGDPIIYVTEGLFGQLSKQKKKIADELKILNDDQNFKIINWEEKSAYDLKLKSPSYQYKEFKADRTIFDFQDQCVPGKKLSFIQTLSKLMDSNDPVFLFTMLHRHVKTMLLVKTNQPTGNMNPYVKSKATSQSRSWEMPKLVAFYEGLARIDLASKTNGTPYDMKKSIEILACYYL